MDPLLQSVFAQSEAVSQPQNCMVHSNVPETYCERAPQKKLQLPLLLLQPFPLTLFSSLLLPLLGQEGAAAAAD